MFLYSNLPTPCKRPVLWAPGLAGLGILLLAGLAHAADGPNPTVWSCAVTRVLDGDTFKKACAGQRLRLWGIDAPEHDQPGHDEATATLRALIEPTPPACLKLYDQPGRPPRRAIVKCTLPDGRDLGAALLQAGVAKELPYFSSHHYRVLGAAPN